jgi:hypothetical protein
MKMPWRIFIGAGLWQVAKHYQRHKAKICHTDWAIYFKDHRNANCIPKYFNETNLVHGAVGWQSGSTCILGLTSHICCMPLCNDHLAAYYMSNVRHATFPLTLVLQTNIWSLHYIVFCQRSSKQKWKNIYLVFYF